MKIKLTALTCLLCMGFSFTGLVAAGEKEKLNEAERVDYIQKQFDESEAYSAVWWYGWIGIYGAAAGVSFGIGIASDDEVVKVTQVVSGFQSVAGLAGLLLSPMPSVYAGDTLRGMRAETPGEKNGKLAEAERLFAETAGAQAMGVSWITHMLNFAVGAAGGVVIWKVYDDEIRDAGGDPGKEALVNFLLSFIIGELQIFTQPAGAIDSWDKYRQEYEPENSTSFFIVPQYNGLYAGAALMF